MRSISTQFHATTEEIVDFIAPLASELGLVITLMTHKPFSVKVIEGELNHDDIISTLKDADINLCLNVNYPDLNSASPNRFLDNNPGTISLHIEKETELGLKESFLSFMSDEDEKIAIAKKVAYKLKKITKAGPTVVNTINGLESKSRNHRYTKGAKTKYDQGVKILPIAGKSYFKLLD